MQLIDIQRITKTKDCTLILWENKKKKGKQKQIEIEKYTQIPS